MIKIPSEIGWRQPNTGETQGTIWSSFGLDLVSKPGVVRVSPRMTITTNEPTDFGLPGGFVFFSPRTETTNNYIWTISGKFVWRSLLTNGLIGAFAKDATTATPTGVDAATSCNDDESDIVTYGSQYLIVTTRTNIHTYDNGTTTWVSHNTPPLSSGYLHKMCVYPGQSRIYFTDRDAGTLLANSVRSATIAQLLAGTAPTTTGSNFLNVATIGIPVTVISTMVAVSDGIWIFTINQDGQSCWAVKWDGVTANVATPHEIKGANAILAAIVIDNVPWVIDSNGQLRYFNGGAFVEAPFGRLPIPLHQHLTVATSVLQSQRWLHPNGITLDSGRINILVNNKVNDNAGSIIENLPSGVWEYDRNIGWYHKRPLSLYLQSGGSVADHGQNRLSRVGALFAMKPLATTATAEGVILAGAQYYTNATGTKYAIWTDNTKDNIQKYGYLVTPKIYSSGIRDIWQKLFARLRQLLNSTDKIIAKYRIDDVDPVEATITWVNTTSFTVASADVPNLAVGDEVEITQGDGGGKCSHVTAITGTATKTVTVDETYTGITTNTAKARFQKWRKMSAFTSQTDDVAEFPFDNITSPWVQIKLCMQFTGKDEVNDLIIANETQQTT